MIIIGAILLFATSVCASPPYVPGAVFNASAFAIFVAASAEGGASYVSVQPGVYNVTPSPGAPSNAHVFLVGLANITVDFAAVTLVCQARAHTAVLVQNCVNVTVEGLTVSYAENPTNVAHLTAIASNGMSVDVTIPDGFPTEDFDSGVALPCNVFDGATRWWKLDTWDMYSLNSTVLGPRSYRLSYANNNGPHTQNIAVGDMLGCRPAAGGSFTFSVQNSENCSVVDVTLLGGPSFGFFNGGTGVVGQRGRTHFTRCRILRPTDSLYSTGADGLHCAGVMFGPIIEGCYFEAMPDDGIAIHGRFSLVTSADVGQRQIWSTSADYAVGDRVRLYSPTFAPMAAVFTVVTVAQAAHGYAPPQNASHTMPSQKIGPGQATYIVITLAEALPAGVGFDCVASNADRTGNGFSIRNSTLYRHRARGMLIKASDGEIVGNVIDGSTMGGIIITPELYWQEAGYAHNLLVANNTIMNVAGSKQGYGGLALGALAPDNAFAVAGGHTNITIIGNTFANISFNNLWVNGVSGLLFSGNTFVAPYAEVPSATCCLPVPLHFVAWLTQASGVVLEGNCVTTGQPANATILLATETVTGQGLQDGIRVC